MAGKNPKAGIPTSQKPKADRGYSPAEVRDAYSTPVQPDAALAAVVGKKPLTRPEICKRVWDYVRKHDLQDRDVKRNIHCDGALRAIFGKKLVTLFETNALLQEHIIPVTGGKNMKSKIGKRKGAPHPQPFPHAVEEGGQWRERVPECTVLHGDCRDLLRRIPKGGVDLIVADLPYGKAYQSNRKRVRGEAIAGDESLEAVIKLLREISRDLARVLRDDGHCYLFSDPLVAPLLPPIVSEASYGGLVYRQPLAWVKGRGMGATDGSRYVGGWEMVLWFTREQKRPLNGHPSDAVWVGRTTRNDLHPTQKDVLGLTTVIEASSLPGEIVLDFCAGSGSTGIACQIGCDVARRTILMDIDSAHCQTMRKRIGAYGPVADHLPERA
jgi:DNA modification methylase